jgi:hypothetical protein
MLSAEKMIRCQLQEDGLDDSGDQARSLWPDTDHMHLRILGGSSRLTVRIVPPLLHFPIMFHKQVRGD